jgi:hypothetical protein
MKMCYFWTEFRSNVCNSKSNAAVPAESKCAALLLPIQTLLNTLHQKMLGSEQCEQIYSATVSQRTLSHAHIYTQTTMHACAHMHMHAHAHTMIPYIATSIFCVGLIGLVKSRQLKSVLIVLKRKHSYSLKGIYTGLIFMKPPFP